MKTKISQRNRWIKWLGVGLIYLLLCIADNVTTYMYTPDLSMEANFLVTQFGLGWKALIISNIPAVMLVLLFAYYPFMRYERRPIQCESFREYVSMLYFGRPDKFTWIFHKTPNNKWLNLAPWGYMITTAAIVSRVWVTVNSILYLNDISLCIFCFLKKPHTYCNMIHFHTDNGELMIPVVMIAIVVVGGLLAGIYWHIKEYRLNKQL